MRFLWVCVEIFGGIQWLLFQPRGSSEACDAGTIEATECTKGDVCVSYYLRSTLEIIDVFEAEIYSLNGITSQLKYQTMISRLFMVSIKNQEVNSQEV